MHRNRTLPIRGLVKLRDQRSRIMPLDGFGPSCEINLALSGTSFPSIPGVTFTMTRNTTTSSYIDSNGNVAFAGPDEPRFTHDPVTRRPLGLLIEGQATNSILRSESFLPTSLGGSWTDSNITRLSAVKPSPANTNTALSVRVAPSTTGTISHTNLSGTRIMSVWIRRTSPAPNGSVRVSSTGSTGGVSYLASQIGTTWERFSSGTGASGSIPRITIVNSSTTENLELEFWGAQSEAASGGTRSGPTSYIPTGASAATRVRDTLEVNGYPGLEPGYYGYYVSGQSVSLGTGSGVEEIDQLYDTSASPKHVVANFGSAFGAVIDPNGVASGISTNAGTGINFNYGHYIGASEFFAQFMTSRDNNAYIVPGSMGPSMYSYYVGGGNGAPPSTSWARTIRNIKLFNYPLGLEESTRLVELSP